jgi:hypothetical protein
MEVKGVARRTTRQVDELSPSFLTWPTHQDALVQAIESGALAEVETALRSAYDLTAKDKARYKPSRVVERELDKAGWRKTPVWTPDGFSTGDSFDGWKEFADGDGTPFGVAVEVQWVWQGFYNDWLKFWRASRGGQAALGIEVMYGPDSFNYVVNHVFALYRDALPDLRVVFCALDAPDLREKFPRTTARSS